MVKRVCVLTIVDERKSRKTGGLEDDGEKKGREEERQGQAIA